MWSRKTDQRWPLCSHLCGKGTVGVMGKVRWTLRTQHFTRDKQAIGGRRWAVCTPSSQLGWWWKTQDACRKDLGCARASSPLSIPACLCTAVQMVIMHRHSTVRINQVLSSVALLPCLFSYWLVFKYFFLLTLWEVWPSEGLLLWYHVPLVCAHCGLACFTGLVWSPLHSPNC